MREPNKPADEARRLSALRAIGLLDGPGGVRFARTPRRVRADQAMYRAKPGEIAPLCPGGGDEFAT
ncbi:hypothetical protein [Alkalilimnicola sp. S0819]|uniref:hypothetical protein n=1 Tax=Alkalilimnicola sp. S0819 TaxID=2613922 RepID=UPI001261B5D8|nr:hypothetical protein [Alkalilimnicola sp. S0819]KAB7623980.1 hypothetical protein F3N43_08030 [Alkalilimnicola sp. S0819]MPQ16583.1 hypothetical protein [Alkalilimnicola sp. S0819]